MELPSNTCMLFLFAGVVLVAAGCGEYPPGWPDGPKQEKPKPHVPAVSEEDRMWKPPAGVRVRDWKLIVMHHSATDFGGAERFNKWHIERRGWDELGYHFVIGNGTDTPDGRIEAGSRWRKQKHGAHCHPPDRKDNYINEHGVGICLVGNFEVGRPSKAQMASAVRLVRWLMKRYSIPLKNVQGHSDFMITKCPGALFPWEEFRAELRKEQGGG